MKSVIFLILIVCLRAQAGAETHGGGVFVCRDLKGHIKNEPLAVELIDLWEGKTNPFHLEIKRNKSPWSIQVKRAMDRLMQWDAPLFKVSTFFLAELPVVQAMKKMESIGNILF